MMREMKINQMEVLIFFSGSVSLILNTFNNTHVIIVSINFLDPGGTIKKKAVNMIQT